MANLQGVVVADKDVPIQGATVTLIGTAAPQAQVTNAQGEFDFPDLPPGNYKLSAVSEGSDPVLRSDIVVTASQMTPFKIILPKTVTKATEVPAPVPFLRETIETQPVQSSALLALIQKWAPSVQTLALSTVAVLFAYYLLKPFGADGISGKTLSNDAEARGVITYLVSVGTITIAMVLVLSVILGSNDERMEKRFALGKEVLSILIGVLGTIIGFYYGTTAKDPANPPADIQMATVKITPDRPVAGTSVNFNTLVTGGEQPYTYSIKFDTDVLPAIVNQPSSDGKISQDISIPANAPAGDIGFQIEVKDKKGAVFTYNKNGQQKLSLQAAAQ